MGFKDEVDRDILSVFMNNNEFAETHKINGSKVSVIVDKEQAEKIQAEYDGIYSGDLYIYVPATSFPKPPKPGQSLNFDNVLYHVEKPDDFDGVYGILLRKSGGFSGP